MRKLFIILYFASSFFYSCNDELGTLNIEQDIERDYSKSLPNLGTLDFKQEYNISTSINNINTKLKLLTNTETTEIVNYEIINFKNNKWSYTTIDFISRDTIKTNQEDFKLINSLGGAFLGDNNTYIAIINPDNSSISGHYTGTGKITSLDENQVDIVEEVFNVQATINELNQILLLPVETSTSFDYCIGTYLTTGEFLGTMYKDTNTQATINNDSDSYIYTNSNIFEDTLEININNIPKKLIITLQKNN